MMKVAFYTLGCKVNTYETEAVMEMFLNRGYQVVDFDDFSDVYIINTCMVTNSGERKSKQVIRRPLAINPHAIVIVMGCLSQLKASQMLEINGVKIVVGTNNRHHIVDYLEEYLNHPIPQNRVENLSNKEQFENLSVNDFKSHQRAFVKIQDGCNNFCSYCIIPYTRGRIRSKAKDLIVEEVKSLVKHGHIEIVLTGIHTGGYGEDLVGYGFNDLLLDLEKIDGLKRIRISSIEITELTTELLNTILRSNKIVHHFHIPLQSGSERILKMMNRKYNQQAYKDKITEIKRLFSDVAITTDVIVGFPGETETEFLESFGFIKEIGFQELHVFPYSKRQGTPADRMPDQIDKRIKKERVQRLIQLSDDLKRNYLNKQIHQTKKVLIEQFKDDYLLGHSKDYVHVKMKGSEDLIGKEVSVYLDEIDFPMMIGVIKK